MISKKRNLFFYGKKGLTYEQFFNVLELVLAIIIILALFFFVSDVAKKTIFEKNYMARDLAILLNTFYAAPGEVTYNYYENLKDFTFNFGDNKVEVSGKEDKGTNIFYPFAKNKEVQFQENILNYENENVNIKFFKSLTSVSITKPSFLNIDIASSQSTTKS